MAPRINPTTFWIVAAVVCALLLGAFVAVFLRPYYQPQEEAIAAGARVEINLRTGEIKQAETPKPEEPEAAAPEEKTEASTEQEAAKETAAEPEKGDSEQSEGAADHKKDAPKEADAKEPAAAVEPKEKDTSKKDTHNTKETAAPAEKAASKDAVEPPAEKKAPKKEPVAEVPKGARIAVIVAGAGLSRSSTDLALKLPAGVSLSFSPYASGLTEWMQKAAKENHEVYLDVPMEPEDYPYTDPGPYALLTSLDDHKNLERLKQVLALGKDYRGVVAGPEERFTAAATSYAWLFRTLGEHKLSFTYVARPSNHQFMQMLGKAEQPALGVDLVLDNKLTNEAIDAQLAQAESMAQQSGFAVVLARPYPISVERIEMWLKTLEAKGIHLVPLSQAKALQ